MHDCVRYSICCDIHNPQLFDILNLLFVLEMPVYLIYRIRCYTYNIQRGETIETTQSKSAVRLCRVILITVGKNGEVQTAKQVHIVYSMELRI